MKIRFFFLRLNLVNDNYSRFTVIGNNRTIFSEKRLFSTLVLDRIILTKVSNDYLVNFAINAGSNVVSSFASNVVDFNLRTRPLWTFWYVFRFEKISITPIFALTFRKDSGRLSRGIPRFFLRALYISTNIIYLSSTFNCAVYTNTNRKTRTRHAK